MTASTRGLSGFHLIWLSVSLVALTSRLPWANGETGSSVAVPIFRDFMAEALRDKPPIPFRIPTGIRLVRVNAKTGKRAVRGDKPVILEAFKSGTEPQFGEGDRRSPTAGSVPGGRVKGLY